MWSFFLNTKQNKTKIHIPGSERPSPDLCEISFQWQQWQPETGPSVDRSDSSFLFAWHLEMDNFFVLSKFLWFLENFSN